MKYTILTVLTCIIFTGCTGKFNSETFIHCPCKITKVNEYKENQFNVKATSISNENNSFSFYTSNRYNIGDTIK